YLPVCYDFFFSSRRRHTRSKRDWSSDVCSSDLPPPCRRRGYPGMDLAGSLLIRKDVLKDVSWYAPFFRSICSRIPHRVLNAASRSEERRVGKERRSG